MSVQPRKSWFRGVEGTGRAGGGWLGPIRGVRVAVLAALAFPVRFFDGEARNARSSLGALSMNSPPRQSQDGEDLGQRATGG